MCIHLEIERTNDLWVAAAVGARSLDGLLLGIGEPTTSRGKRDWSNHRKKWQFGRSLHCPSGPSNGA